MYHNIYQITKASKDKDRIDADFLSDFPYLMSREAYVADVEDREAALAVLSKWMKEEEIGVLEGDFFILNASVNTGSHFAKRYAGFRKIVTELSEISEDDYLYRFHDVRNLASDLMKSIVDEADDLVCIDMGRLIPMDEFLRTAKPNVPYYIGGICKYHL